MYNEQLFFSRPNRTLLITGTILFVLYYLADCSLDSLIFGEGTFTENLLNPSAHEVAIRTLSGFFLFSLYIVSTILINKNRKLQKGLLEKSQEILEANRKLDAYNYTLSHDLKNSLTSIMLSKERLRFDYHQCDSPRGKEILDQLGEDCDQLSARINETLQFSESNHNKLERKRVAIDDIAREIAKDLSEKAEGHILDFQIDNNLQTDCDPKLMHVVLQNLIASSTRNTTPHQHHKVRIGMKKRGGVPVYFIRSHKTSTPGCQLHTTERPDRPPELSNVINIKTARTIIERHGGQLWAKDSNHDNPTFYFTL